MTDMSDHEVTVEQEIANISMGRPHVIILGAGVNKAALPNGDKNGKPVPILREIAADLNLLSLFPSEFHELAELNFEAAYSQLFDQGQSSILDEINKRVYDYFSELELPDEANLYDQLTLSLREKDVIFTFNWDPFLIQSRIRLAKLGVTSFPRLFFLHGNVRIGFCKKDKTSGLPGLRCTKCGQFFKQSQLMYPVQKKNYKDGDLIEREWDAAQSYLKCCFMLTIFGYSAPQTDVEAIELLKKGWGEPQQREMEQTEIINRPGADHDQLLETWAPFIHSHHSDVWDSFYDSSLGNHPRRSGEAYWNQYIEAKWISENPVPREITNLVELVEWHRPLFEVEQAEK